jgi:cytochrome P450
MGLQAELNQNPFVPTVPRPPVRPLHPLTRLYRFWRNPLEVWSDSRFRERRSSFPYFGAKATLLNDPEDINLCFVKNGQSLVHADIRQRIAKPLLDQGVLVAEGEAWRAGRRMLGHALTAQRNIDAAGEIASALAEAPTAWVEDGATIRLTRFNDSLVLNLLSKAMFSGDLDPLVDDILTTTEGYFGSYGRTSPLDLLPGIIHPRGRRHRQKLRQIVRDIVKRRVTRPDLQRKPDGLDAIIAEAKALGAPRHLVEDNVLTLLITGHETVSLALTWTLFLLARSTDALTRVRSELDGADLMAADPASWGQRLPYLLACFKEAMRLYPPGPIIARKLTDDIALSDATLPRGSIVFINTWILHRHELLWRNPSAFMPERFLPENKDEVLPYAYLPFGIGHKACMGAQLALFEGVVVLASLLKTYDFDYVADRDPKPILKITVSPDNGVPMRVTHRRQPALAG